MQEKGKVIHRKEDVGIYVSMHMNTILTLTMPQNLGCTLI